MTLLFVLIAFVIGCFVGSHNSQKIENERAKLEAELKAVKAAAVADVAAVKATL